jgi:hypothetical protein
VGAEVGGWRLLVWGEGDQFRAITRAACRALGTRRPRGRGRGSQ